MDSSGFGIWVNVTQNFVFLGVFIQESGWRHMDRRGITHYSDSLVLFQIWFCVGL